MNELKNIEAVLEELYGIDPSLREHDASIRKLAKELLALKPEAPLDESFIAKLRSEVIARSTLMENAKSENFFARIFSLNKSMSLAPGLAILALVIVGAVTVSSLKRDDSTSISGLALAPKTERVAAGSFGPLMVSGTSRSMSGGGGMGAGPTSAPMAGGDSEAATKMIAPGDWTPTYFKHTYKGEALGGLMSQVDVYRRVRGSKASADALKGFGLGLIDLGRARSAGLQSFSIAEDRDQGYVITVNQEDGSVNINENYLKWNYPERSCTDEACVQSFRLKESDMLADDELVRIAEAFLAEYGISKDGYGTPIIRDDWRGPYLIAADKQSFWFPDAVNVTYPQNLDGKVVYDESGSPYGMNVIVNIRHKRASGLWNLVSREFEVASYAAETDASKLIKVAEKGGVYGNDSTEPNAKIVDVELGTPTLVYSRFWQWSATGGSDVMAPALSFPVMNAPQDYWSKNIVVPLAQELLQAPTFGGGAPMPL